MKWSEYAWKQIEEYYQLILAMPFVKELAEGSLSKEKFQFYMAQDSLYLEHFGRALALIGARAYNIQDVLSFTRFAENAIVVENALHESYFKDFDVTEKGKMQPVCHHYVHFLKVLLHWTLLKLQWQLFYHVSGFIRKSVIIYMITKDRQ